MTLQHEAEAIFAQLISRHPRSSPWLSFSDDKTCPNKQAARNFIASINARIAKQPQLLTCMLDTVNGHKFDVDTKTTPLFIVLQMWIYKNYSHKDKNYAKQLLDWLQGAAQLLPTATSLPGYLQHRYAEFIEILLNAYDILSFDFVNIDKLVEAVERQIPASKIVFAKFAKRIIDQHYEEVFWDAGRNKQDIKTTLQHRQRMAEFINQMRIASIVDENTVAQFIDYSESDNAPYPKYTQKAVSFFATQTILPGYEKLRKTTTDLIIDTFKQSLSHNPDLIRIQKIEDYVTLYNQRKPSDTATLAAEIITCIDFYLTQTEIEPETENNLRCFSMQQAIASQSQANILLALKGLSALMKKQTNSNVWFDLFDCGVKTLGVPGIDKNLIAIEVIKLVTERFDLEAEQLEKLRTEICIVNPNPGKLLFGIMFAATDIAMVKRPRYSNVLS